MPNPNLCDESALTFESINLAADGCACNVQFTRIAFARRSWLDLENMTVDEMGCPTNIIMAEQGFFEITGIDADFVTYTASLDEATCKYNNTFTIDMQAVTKQLRLLGCNMQSFCDWVIWGSTNTCQNYLLGVEDLGGGNLGSSFKSKFSGHEISIGGTNQVSNAWSFTWSSYCEGGETLVDYNNLPLI